MKGISIVLPGKVEPDGLLVREREHGPPGPGKLLVRVEATGVSFAEVQMRRGRYPGQPAYPFVPGYDLAGVVEQVGPGTSGFAVGDRVAVMTLTGAWAEHAEVDAAHAVRIPDAVSARQAAAVIVNGVTAWRMLEDARVAGGDTVLVHGAGGGVGTLLVQLARARGARVIGTGREGQRGVIEALGAELVDYRREDVASRVRQLVPGGASAIFDHVGGASLRSSYGLLAPGGTLISYGSASTRDERGSAWTPIVRHTLWALWMNLRPGTRRVRMFDVWGRTELGLRRATFQARFRADLATVLALVERGQLGVTIAASFPLERAADALRLHESGASAGKILLEPVPAARV